MIFSKEQIAIENEVKTGTGNVIVQATAGAGKTTTLLKCLGTIPAFKKTIFLSFSKFIVDELRERVPKSIKACTLHSLGYGMLANRFPGIKLDEDKYLKIAIKMFPPSSDLKKGKENFKFACQVKDIVNFARMTLVKQSVEEIRGMCNYYSLEYTQDLIEKTLTILKDVGKTNMTTMDFTDMLYIPVLKPDLVTVYYDFIFVDEVQDNSQCQLQFVNIIGNKNARFIMVGDENQAIYSFMGASVDSFQQAKSKFNAKLFTLPVSHRCPKQVVYFAQGIYDTIQFHESAKEGDVRIGKLNEVREGDMVLCRNTLPLVYAFFELIERNIKATIVGKDIEQGLVEFAKSVSAYSFEQIEKNMAMLLDSLVQELKGYGIQKVENNKKYGALVEKIHVINLILNKIKLPTHLVDKIHEIFHEDKKAARLMSIHRCKGGQNDRVFIIESFRGKILSPSEYATSKHELVAEANISFVAATRSKEELILVEL